MTRSGSPALRRARLNMRRRMAHGWPYCEHDGTERIVGTAADHVAQIKHVGFCPEDERGFVRGITLLAAQTGPEELIGVCPVCFCMTTENAHPHPQQPVKGAAGRP